MTHLPTQRRKKKSPAAFTSPESSIAVPTPMTPTPDTIDAVVESAADDTGLVAQETWLYRWGIFGYVCLIGVALLACTFAIKTRAWERKLQHAESAVVPSVAPSPTPVQFVRSGIIISVSNGTGISGRARYVSTALTSLGYEEGEIETAANIVTNNTVVVSADLEPVIDQIKADMHSILEGNTEYHVEPGKPSRIRVTVGRIQQ